MESCGKVIVKLVVISIKDSHLQIFLPQGKLPSSALEKMDSLDQLAKDIFQTKTGCLLQGRYFEQLYTFSNKKKERVEVDVVYYFLVPSHLISEKKRQDWQIYSDISKTYIDYKIINYAIKRLRWKIEYTNAVYSLLPNEFTFSELQTVYEAILGKSLDKRNFRKKILSLNLLKSTGKIKKMGRARPAEIFSFRKKKLAFVEII